MTLRLGGDGAITGCTSLENPDLTVSGLTISGSFDAEKVLVASGTAAAPSYTFSGDTDNGLYYAGTNSIGLATAGTNVILIDSSGRVGVGTDSPNADLHVKGPNFVTLNLETTGSSTNQLLFTRNNTTEAIVGHASGDNSFYLQNELSGPLLFGTNATERMRIDSSGKVGIGTTSPGSLNSAANQLVIGNGSEDQGLTIYTSTSTQGSIFFADGTTGGAQQAAGYVIYYHGTNYMAFGTANTERLRIDSSGNVRIGTTDTGTAKLRFDNALDTTPSDVNKIHLFNNGATIAGFGISSGQLNYKAPAHVFYLDNNSQAAVIDSSGRLLVGTSSSVDVGSTAPAIMQVTQGTTGLSGAFYSTANALGPGGVIALGHGRGSVTGLLSDDDVIGQIRFAGADGTDMEPLGAQISAEVDGTPGVNDMPGRLVFSTTADGASSPTERMRIDSAGAVGIGITTPNIGDGPINASAVGNGAGTTNTRLFMSGYELTSGNLAGLWFGARNDENTGVIGSRTASGNISFETYTGGWGERMRITNNGAVGIGTTAPGAKFHINGVGGIYGQSLHVTGWGNNIGAAAFFQAANTLSADVIYFNTSAANVGKISINSTSTSYVTTSDYRLKENVTPINQAIERLNQLKPSRFNFIAEPGRTVDGFLAHEAQVVVPESVTGTKDEVDDNGDPVMQGIDQSKLVPLLTAALQEAIAKIETLEAEVAALKAQ